jgi:1-acyl-sn-glycerol-3-phosphate acyltransferase
LSHADSKAVPAFSESRSFGSWLRTPWDYLAMAIGLSYWGIFGTLFTIIGGVLYLMLPPKLGQNLGRKAIHQIFRWFVFYLRASDLVRSDLRALAPLKNLHHPIIVAPNHTSLWDVVFIIARLPQGVCVIKESILRNFVLGGAARLARYIPNGATTRMIRDAADSLSENGHLLIFPEGTRTAPDARWINPLKGGCALIACRAKTPVYPLFIRSNTRFLQKGWPLWKRPIFPIHLQIDLGEPVFPSENESPQQFTLRLQSIYEQELAKPHPLRRQMIPTSE